MCYFYHKCLYIIRLYSFLYFKNKTNTLFLTVSFLLFIHAKKFNVFNLTKSFLFSQLFTKSNFNSNSKYCSLK